MESHFSRGASPPSDVIAFGQGGRYANPTTDALLPKAEVRCEADRMATQFPSNYHDVSRIERLILEGLGGRNSLELNEASSRIDIFEERLAVDFRAGVADADALQAVAASIQRGGIAASHTAAAAQAGEIILQRAKQDIRTLTARHAERHHNPTFFATTAPMVSSTVPRGPDAVVRSGSSAGNAVCRDWFRRQAPCPAFGDSHADGGSQAPREPHSPRP